MTTYGYIRKDETRILREQLMSIFPYDCDEFFIENENLTEDVELQKCLKKLSEGDILVITDLESIGQRVSSVRTKQFIKEIQSKKIRFISLKDQIDTAVNPLFLEHYLLLNQMDKKIETKYRIQGLKINGNSKSSFGRPKIAESTEEKIKKLYLQKKTFREIAKECAVSLGTVHKYVKVLKEQEQEEYKRNFFVVTSTRQS